MNFNSDRREEIKSRVTIADVIRKYSPSSEIKKDVMRCPFHSERTASFRVYRSNNSFYCFGCGVGGDQINFVAKMLDISYYDALKRVDEDFMLAFLAEKYQNPLCKNAYMSVSENNLKKKKQNLKDKQKKTN